MIKLPNAPDERLQTGTTVPLPALKTALERVIGQTGFPATVELTQAKPAGFLKDPIECLVIAHATDRKNYQQVVLTQAQAAVSARLMVYYVGNNKYTRAMRAGEMVQHPSLTTDLISGVTRMLNADKAQQQEMYFEDLGGVVVQAIELVRSGEVRAEAPRPAAAPAPAPRPAPAPQPAPARPAPQPAAASRPEPRPAPAPQPTYRTVPMDQVAGEKVRATCACPDCGAALTVTVPNANCLVNITCTECGRTFPMEVRRHS
ncbi:hypothetical protein H6A07_09000 [Olsenella uli]|uniref:hypothetical protein n=1 Tax=Olsenella uli TaxID=133926 RepID=UPI001959343F|nr:hypothetical protein [Olsenella uli]MBM6676871.1 hypothetical protein [Olsenella uli]